MDLSITRGVSEYGSQLDERGIETMSEGTISCHYVLTLQNGKKVDSSRDRGRPFQFTMGKNEVIKGWEKRSCPHVCGQRAKVTISTRHGLWIPWCPRSIPPNSVLTFDIELLRVD
ncbi:Peptidylprolyl isomerase [Caligus rogercresseyi]|uniref:peptidylprolyl isomerase n=1 Tax=Caligus rogercresseyi TaxID=217165 RepID=A0A7T8GV79_CALRO|nr:Peptidylprolyl isomerase [Caligus rogercresseyi]